MCGIAGYYHLQGNGKVDYELLGRMVGMLRHRGPDEFGAYFNDSCALGQARLSIIDLTGGSQPLSNEDGTIWITFNGEIFNYIELRSELEKFGHRFKTKTDTEVIVHAYEQWGTGCFNHFNGQWAFALFDSKDKSLLLSRDRVGVRPLFYTSHKGTIYFASEIKAIFSEPSIPRGLDLCGLDEIFTLWATSPPRTVFDGINELGPGSYMQIKNGKIHVSRYWQMEFPEVYDRERSLNSWAEELHDLLIDSVRLRLRSDVPVGAYLSGGLDSSATTSLARHFCQNKIETFSIAFHDKAYDESKYQNEVASYLGTNHHQIRCGYREIAENFPKTIWHTEKPILRTAPVPLLMLSGLVRHNNFKVVLTGEGADEVLGGYDIFKETLIRHFWAKNPNSKWRPLLLQNLYPTLPLSPKHAKYYLETFYKNGLSETDNYSYSHMPRIRVTSRIKEFFTDEVLAQLENHDALASFKRDIPAGFDKWHHLARAQYLETSTLLSGYLLSSQGDRVTAANSVEGRFPFLDYRVIEFGAKIPPGHKILGLKEKIVLKKAMRDELPAIIMSRVKQPYMAPDSNSFFQPDSPEYVQEILSEREVKENGIFRPEGIAWMNKKCSRLFNTYLSFKDNMSFVGVLSTQLLVEQYINNFEMGPSLKKGNFKVWLDMTKEQHVINTR